MYSSVQVNSQRIVHSRLAQCLYSEWINSSSSKCSGSSVVLGSVITWLAVLKAPFAFILRSRNGVNATCNLRKFRKKLRLFFRELQRTQPIHRHSRMSTADSCQVHYQRALRNLRTPFTRYNRLSKRFDNRFHNRLTTGCIV